jgi:hypothetical protein
MARKLGAGSPALGGVDIVGLIFLCGKTRSDLGVQAHKRHLLNVNLTHEVLNVNLTHEVSASTPLKEECILLY